MHTLIICLCSHVVLSPSILPKGIRSPNLEWSTGRLRQQEFWVWCSWYFRLQWQGRPEFGDFWCRHRDRVPPGPHDTGSQFVQIKCFGWSLRFLRLNSTEGQGLLFSRILSLKIIVNFTYRPASWFDTGWLFSCLFQLSRILFNLFFSSRLMLFESS